jgi:hypothetical protein
MARRITREPQYGRYALCEDGKWEVLYTATDPAVEMMRCTCGKPRCLAARAQPFREHIAELYRTIAACQSQGMLGHAWDAVLYPLQMAASVEDVHADTAFVDNTMAITMCRPAYEYAQAQSEVASKYVAASSVFSFVWAAYEATVRLTAPDEFTGLAKQHATGKRGRSLVEARPALFSAFSGVRGFVRAAQSYCERGGLFEARLEGVRQRYPTHDFVAAAELLREFRNHLYHGEDQPPEPEDWAITGQTKPRIYRFYAVARLALLLIQFLTRISVEDADEIEVGYDDDTGEDLYARPSEVLSRLHLKSDRSEESDVAADA